MQFKTLLQFLIVLLISAIIGGVYYNYFSKTSSLEENIENSVEKNIDNVGKEIIDNLKQEISDLENRLDRTVQDFQVQEDSIEQLVEENKWLKNKVLEKNIENSVDENIETQKKAEEKILEAQKKAEEEKKILEEEKLVLQKKIEEQRKKYEDEKKRLEEETFETQKKAEEEILEAQKKAEEEKKRLEQEKTEDVKNNQKNSEEISNTLTEVEYLTTDKKGNRYRIFAKSAQTSKKDKNILDLDEVRGIITSDKRSTIYIVSDFAKYNSSNLNSNFYQNVVINFEDKQIDCDFFDVDMQTSMAIAYGNVIVTDPKSIMRAGKITLDIQTKDINIEPEVKKKINIETE